uniref:hypothetical protein n=1 Tax=Olsenella timonensis TaxID=1805478 RepID=UPI000A58BF2C|nr:hypothetical protein [Olsenella timonensis]
MTAGILSDDGLRRLLAGRVMRRFGRALPEGSEFDLRQRQLVRELLDVRGA